MDDHEKDSPEWKGTVMKLNHVPWISTQLNKPQYRALSREEEHLLFARLKSGDKRAKDLIVNHNLKFVVRCAVKYAGRGLPVEDLIAEGAIGVQRAAADFDPTAGHTFLTYAVWWIRQAILTALAETGRVIRLPPNRVFTFTQVGKAEKKLAQKLLRAPSVEEVAEESGLQVRDVVEAHRYCSPVLGLEFHNEEGRELTIRYEGPSPDSDYQDRIKENFNEAIVSGLSPIDQEILNRYCGKVTGSPQTLEEIGSHLGVSRERVRQRRARSIDVVRKRARALRGEADRNEAMENASAVRDNSVVSIGRGFQ